VAAERSVNYLDLFSGIGGFALGAYNAGWRFERHYFSEIDPWCCRLYARRFPDAVPLGDIREIDGKALVADAERSGSPCNGREQQPSGAQSQPVNDHSEKGWIITGGFPCQDISVAGKGAGITGLRSGLWFEYARLIGEIRPRYAIMENVGVLTRRGLDRVLGSLAEIGYDAEWSDIRASDVGAPHRRERIWIVAYPDHSKTARQREDGGKRLSLAESIRPDQSGESFSVTSGIGEVERGNTGLQSPHGHDGVREDHRGGTAQHVSGQWWAVEPDVGRVAHGISVRVDRLRGLGNSNLPQIAEMIFR
jgi:DNA (cytosine-5)-methyltransferase 1